MSGSTIDRVLELVGIVAEIDAFHLDDDLQAARDALTDAMDAEVGAAELVELSDALQVEIDRFRAVGAKMRYHVVLEEGPECYGVTVPRLPGCISADTSPDRALESVKDAIELHVSEMIKNGEAAVVKDRLSKSDWTSSGVELVDGSWFVVDVVVPVSEVAS